MTEFIQQAMQSLGTGQAETESATGGLLSMVKGKLGEGDFSELAGKLPGAEALLSKAPSGDDAGGGGGLLGGLMGQATGALGGEAGETAGIAGMLEKSGIGMDKAGPLVSMFLGFVRDKAGDGLLGKVLEKVPALGQLGG